MLAELGYTALALDMYGEGRQAHHPDEAAKFSGELAKNLPLAKARFESAMKLLQQQKNVDATNIAALGYCFGGSVVLQMARLGENMKGAVSFHGSPGNGNAGGAGQSEGADYFFYRDRGSDDSGGAGGGVQAGNGKSGRKLQGSDFSRRQT